MSQAAESLPDEFPITLTIERSVLLRSLARLQSIVEKRNTIPILSNVKLDAQGGTLQITVTDMDIVATEKVEASISNPGSLTVPAGTFYDIVRKLPDGSQISLDTDTKSHQIIVKAASARFTLSYLPSEDFPVMSEGELSHSFTMKSETFLALIDKSRFAMSTEETRYYLNGVFLHSNDSEDGKEATLRAVATDGHRLARIESPLPSGASGMPGIIIPRKTVNELHKLLNEQGEDVVISLSDSKIRFESGNLILLSKLVDGTFPDYTRVIPQDNNKLMEVDAKAFSNAVDRVATITSDRTRGVKFSIENGTLTLSAHSAENGTAKESLDVTYSADPLEIGFNARYVLEMMGQLEGETAQFLLSDNNSPALVTDPSDVLSLYVIMPMRV